MIIITRIDDLLQELWPEAGDSRNNYEALRQRLTDYYTRANVKPGITIEDGLVRIEIDTGSIEKREKEFSNVIRLCERGDFDAAKPLLKDLISSDPTNSEYYRIYGQILSEEGNQEEAIDYLIDALKWGPTNENALIMMGNILAKYRNDPDTAMKYYEKAIEMNPDNVVATVNIAAYLAEQGRLEEAKRLYNLAIERNDSYPNAYLGLSIVARMKGDLLKAFQLIIDVLKRCNKQEQVCQNALKLAFSVAQEIMDSHAAREILRKYARDLETAGGKRIVMTPDDSIPYAAKIEYAENHNRPAHYLKYNPKYPAGDHLRMHELTHLRFSIEARKANENMLFISNQSHQRSFMKRMEQEKQKMLKSGISTQDVEQYLNSIFEGINMQVFNAPVDLFIEDFLYQEFSVLRPYQFVSLFNLLQEAIKAVTDKDIVSFAPRDILSKSKIYNIVGAIQFRELYHLDLVPDFKATLAELKQAEQFYNEFLEYSDDRETGEEFELMLHWAQDLELDEYFDLVEEEKYRSGVGDLDDIAEEIEKDPFGMEEAYPAKEKATRDFIESQEEMGTNMAVVTFMVGALEYFSNMDNEKVREIAFEIAMQGTQGYSPDKKGYKLHTVPGKSFSGYHILAWYYVSWKIIAPEMVPKLGLPYDEEYEMARKLFENTQNE